MLLEHWKISIIAITLVIIGLLLSLWALARISQSGLTPGLINGRLSSCPKTPNCVCSELSSDRPHFIQPIYLSPKIINPWLAVPTTIESLGGKIVVREPNYISATFKSRFFGFIDDVEIRHDPDENKIHLRSASRVGYSDGGVNRKRVENIRETLEATSR